VIGIAFEEILMDAVQGLPGDLRPTGVIQEDGWAIERGELAADDGQVESH
jgi:hypothetical protein